MLSDERARNIIKICIKMIDIIPCRSIALLLFYIDEFEGLVDLIEMWDEEKELSEKELIMTDILDLLKDIENSENPGVHEHGGN